MRLLRKTDRRSRTDRRGRTRAGRREQDPTPAVFCRRCGSSDIAMARLGSADRMLKCRACDHSWFVRSRKNG
jgi:hypothetical protein